MLVLPLLSVFAAVVSVHAAHDSHNLSHARRSMSMRQAQAARYRQRADAARAAGDGPGFTLPSDIPDGSSPFATPSGDDGASSASSSPSDSPSISLPGATSTDLDSSSTSASASVPTTDSASASVATTDSASASITDAPPSSTDSASASATTTSATDTNIFSELSSILSSVLSTLTNTDTAPVSTSDSVIFSSTAVFSPSITITDPPPSSVPTSDSASSSASDTGISIPFSLSLPISISTTDGPSSSSVVVVSQSDSSISISTSDAPPPPSSSSSVDTGPVSSSVIISSSAIISSSVVGFPGSSSSIVSDSVSVSSTSPVTVSSTTTTIVTVPSDLSFILSESSLALASVPVTSSLTLSNPDAPTTTISFTASAQTALSTAALPTGLPTRIYPPTGAIDNPGGNYSFVSLLFDGYLGWQFVCTNGISSTQIFAMMPVILATALGTSIDDVKTYALQVRVPDSYSGPADVDQLQTMFLLYLRTEYLDPLALQLKSRNSAFYTGLPGNQVATELAQHVVSAFALNSVAAPPSSGSGSGSGKNGNSANDLSATSQSKTRQDAIIGVVTALGAIALIVLIFLAYRAFKRRAELAHHRLSDPPDMGVRPDGREFDQDSVGGQRRRSFYFAEDSLRGFSGDEPAYNPGGGAGMTQRRNVMPAAISAPILQQSSMNW